jgi:hypothetical protein
LGTPAWATLSTRVSERMSKEKPVVHVNFLRESRLARTDVSG